MILRERLFLWFPVAQRLRRTFGHQAGIGIRAAPVRFASGPYRRISGPNGPAGLARASMATERSHPKSDMWAIVLLAAVPVLVAVVLVEIVSLLIG